MIQDYALDLSTRTPWKIERNRVGIASVVRAPTFSVNATPAKFDVSAFAIMMTDGSIRYFAAQTAQVFSAVHATGIAAWLGIGIYSDANGRIFTAAFPNTGDQDYATEDLALASIPIAPAGYTKIGQFTLLTAAADWDANTDALDAADLVAANLLGVQADRRILSAIIGYNFQVERFRAWCRATAGTCNLELFVPKRDTNGCATAPHLAVDKRAVSNANATRLRFGAFDIVVNGVVKHIPAAKQQAFTAAHVVAIDSWGAILLLINNTTGVYSTLVSGATQTTPQAYANSALARAALPATPSGYTAIGVLVIEADNSTWTANTDDIVAGSDLEGFDLIPALMDRSLTNVSISITAAEHEDFSLSALSYTLEGVLLAKVALTGNDFSANHVCTASKWLAILVQVDNAGAISTRVPLVSGRSQTAAQGYDSYDLAVAALPNTEIGKLAIGFIVVQADSGGWTANTDDLTPGSDLTNSWLVGLTTIRKNGFSSIEDTRQNQLWPVSGAQFAANTDNAYTLPTDPAVKRGWETTSAVLYAASLTGTAEDVRADWIHRPFPLNGEVVAATSAES